MTKKVASAKRLTARQRAARDQRVLDMFVAGSSHRAIAARVGVSHTTVAKVLRRDLDERAAQRQHVGEPLALAERQNELLKAHWQAALGGDVASARVVLAVLRMQEKAVERAQVSAAVGEVVDAEVVDDEVVDVEPPQRAIGEARRLSVVRDIGSDDERDRGPELDVLEVLRSARAGDPQAQLLLAEASRRYEIGNVARENRTWRDLRDGA